MSSHIRTARIIALIGAIVAGTAGAQGAPPPVRPLGPVLATASTKLTGVVGVIQLGDGQVVVNDATARRLLMLDSTLANMRVVADSTSEGMNSYGTRPGLMIAYRGDSTLLADLTTLSMLVIDPAGRIARVKAVPRTQDAPYMTSTVYGTPAFDAQGRLVYRIAAGNNPPITAAKGAISLLQPRDSAPVIRVDLVTRRVDTAGAVRVTKTVYTVIQNAQGLLQQVPQQNPMQLVDEWAVMADGSIAFVRGQDYHVDWFNTDGTWTASPKMPFDWVRMTEADKVHMIDSVRTLQDRTRAQQMALIMAQNPGINISLGVPPSFVPPQMMSDYKPPFSNGAVRADADNNLWIRTIPLRATPGAGLIYDIVNRQGVLTDRVQLPANSTVVGFGKGGIVYLFGRDPTGTKLVKARVK